ncbi:MAG: hypothetical protein NTW65_04650 [Deltaproteobacteria bacterium]|nr:hypothetical protein [Deltaproteobacteria bacterium]
MVVERCISLVNPSEWKDALKGIKHAFSHTWENCYAMHLTTGLPTYLYSIEIGESQIVCPISERTFGGYTDIFTPYGFSGFISNKHCPEFPGYWKEFVERKKYVCGYIQINPILEDSSLFYSIDSFHYNNVHILDLKLTLEELFMNLSNNRKPQLKHWDEISKKITYDKSILLDFFLNHYHNFMQSRNVSGTYNFARDTLSFLANLENVLIVGLQNLGRVEAVSLFGYSPIVGDYLFNISLPEGKVYTTALLWAGVIRLQSMGVKILNLGGGVRADDTIDLYKRRFGGKQLPLKSLKQVYNRHIYEQLCQHINADPYEKMGYFPAYQKP